MITVAVAATDASEPTGVAVLEQLAGVVHQVATLTAIEGDDADRADRVAALTASGRAVHVVVDLPRDTVRAWRQHWNAHAPHLADALRVAPDTTDRAALQTATRQALHAHRLRLDDRTGRLLDEWLAADTARGEVETLGRALGLACHDLDPSRRVEVHPPPRIPIERAVPPIDGSPGSRRVDRPDWAQQILTTAQLQGRRLR